MTGHLSIDSRIADVLNHPAFAGFARRLLPWDDRSYYEDMPLSEIRSLLPFHTRVEPRIVTRALNRIIDDVNRGTTVFYAFYGELDCAADSTRENTGLFFFRGRPGAPFAIVVPGGGFSYVASVHEGFPYAVEINKHGFNAFVLKYRVGQGSMPASEDMAAAISYVLGNAAGLRVGARDYSLWGSSAGARLAALVGSHGARRFGGDSVPRPSVVVMAYTSHSDYSTNEPKTFVIAGGRDRIAPPSTMARRVSALRRQGVDVEYHEYADAAHGFGLGTRTSAEGWIEEAIRFWAQAISWRAD